MVYYLIIIAIIAADQLVKHIVATSMVLGQSIPVAGGLFNITYIQNSGAAFSFLESHSMLIIVVTSVLIAVGLVYVTRHLHDRKKFFMISLAIIIGGGSGNLIDRIVNGQVTDFIDFKVWPIFNVADICVCVGCILLCIYVIFIDGRNHAKK